MTITHGSSDPPLDRAIIVGHGARATEELLLADLGRLLEARPVGSIPDLPIRIIVSSRPLRDHLAATISRRFAAARLGVVCQTLPSVARQILAVAGEERADGTALIPLLARRAARAFAPLRQALEGLSDGYGAVVASVQDLLDAGLDPALSEGLEEALSERKGDGAARAEVERAAALLSVASEVSSKLEEVGRRSPASTYLEAALALRQRGPDLLPCALVLFHGWADATGAATDLIEALLREIGARLYLDTPLDPAAPDHIDAGIAFTRRLSERLELTLARRPSSQTPHLIPEIEVISSPNTAAETRSTCDRIHRLLAVGHAPEKIAIVARDLAPYRAFLRTHLRRLGIPFSAPFSPGPLLRRGRMLAGLNDLLADGTHTEIGRWIQLLPPSMSAASRASINLVLSAAGAGRLEGAAFFESERVALDGRIILPITSGESVGGEGDSNDSHAEDDGAGQRGRQPRLGAQVLEEAIAAARKTRQALTDWAERASFSEHRARIDSLLGDLGWRREETFRGAIGEALSALESLLPPNFTLDREELAILLERELADWGREPWGGEGAGVQLLSALHARSLTFDHLFLLGVNRGGFPRAISEDPMLPDPLRQILAGSGAGPLPDLALKRDGSIEERYLFAQLLSAADTVYVSWHEQDEQGNSLSPSPLVARMLAPLGSGSGSGSTARNNAPQTALEQTVDAAERSGIEALADLLPVAIDEAEKALASDRPESSVNATDPHLLARFRAAVVRAFEAKSFSSEGNRFPHLGPFHGSVGRLKAEGAPGTELYVTTLERLARCPWQLFVEQLLGVEPVPDPLASLPGVEAAWVGGVVHRVLEKVVAATTGRHGDLSALDRRPGQSVPWPPEPEVERLLSEAAQALVRSEGVALDGVAALLAEAARQALTTAHRIEWVGGDLEEVLGAEINGEVHVEGLSTRLRFRADRVDRTETGLRLTDYKSGRPLSRKKTPKGRRADLQRTVASGRYLQAVAYAMAATGGGEGRYLFLDHDSRIAPEWREVVVDSGDQELLSYGRAAIETLIAAWQGGVFLPRLTEADRDQEPDACRTCVVAEACVRGDSGMRRQLFSWGQRAIAESPSSPAATLWRLALAKDGGAASGMGGEGDDDV